MVQKRTILLAVLVCMLSFVFVTTAFAAEPTLTNPLGNVNDPRIIIGNIIRATLGIVGSISLAIFILGGFYWVTAAGNDEKIKKGKDMILWATFGLAVIFFAYAVVTFIIGAIVGGDGASGTTPLEGTTNIGD